MLHWMRVGVTGATCIPSSRQDMRSAALDACGSDGSDLLPRTCMVLYWMSLGVTGATCIPSPRQDMRGAALDGCGSDGSDLHPLTMAGHVWYCTGWVWE